MNPDFQHYTEHRTALSANIERRRSHEGYSVNYTHELGDEAKESSGRFVVRAVPLLYGVLVGVLLGNLAGGLLIGALVSVVADTRMGSHSLARPLFGSFARRGCPVVALIARGVVMVLACCGIDPPKRLRDIHCGAA